MQGTIWDFVNENREVDCIRVRQGWTLAGQMENITNLAALSIAERTQPFSTAFASLAKGDRSFFSPFTDIT
jgi:hypothetical protein